MDLSLLELIEHLARQFVQHTETKKAPTQMFVTTHSPYFVDALKPTQVWSMRKAADGRAIATRVGDLTNVKTLTAEGVPLGAQWYSNHFEAPAEKRAGRSRR